MVGRYGLSNYEIRNLNKNKNILGNYDLAIQYLNQGHIHIASDLIRYDLIFAFGGIYLDLDYRLLKLPDKEIKNFDFIGISYRLDYYFALDHSVFGAKPLHPVIEEAQKISRENCLKPNSELQSLYNVSLEIFQDKSTAETLGYSYFDKAHQLGNNDVVYPMPEKHQADLYRGYAPCSYSDFSSTEEKNFYYYLQSHEICPTDEFVLGYDEGDFAGYC